MSTPNSADASGHRTIIIAPGETITITSEYANDPSSTQQSQEPESDEESHEDTHEGPPWRLVHELVPIKLYDERGTVLGPDMIVPGGRQQLNVYTITTLPDGVTVKFRTKHKCGAHKMLDFVYELQPGKEMVSCSFWKTPWTAFVMVDAADRPHDGESVWTGTITKRTTSA